MWAPLSQGLAWVRASAVPYAALSGTYFAHIGFFNPFLPLWLDHLGYGVAMVSLMVSLPSATRLYAPYLWGWLSDRTGRPEVLMRIAAVGAALVSLLLWGSWPAWGMLAVLILLFSMTGAMMPLSEGLLVKRMSAGGHFDARGYGRVRLWGSMGFLATVLAAGVAFESHGLDAFVVWSTTLLSVVVLSTWLLPSSIKSAATTRNKSVRFVMTSRLRWMYGQLFFHVLAHAVMYIFYSLYLDQLGYSKSTIGALWAISVVAEIVWFYTQSYWMKEAHVGRWLVAVSVAAVVRFGALTIWADWPAVVWTTQILHALTFAAHHTLCMALITRECAPETRGRAQAMYTTIGYGLAAVVAGLCGGAVVEWIGLQWVFALAAASASMAVWMAWKLSKTPASHANEPTPI